MFHLFHDGLGFANDRNAAGPEWPDFTHEARIPDTPGCGNPFLRQQQEGHRLVPDIDHQVHGPGASDGTDPGITQPCRQHRSTSPDIGDYGAGLAGLITGFAPAASLPCLADVARLEWAWHRAINAPDETALDTADAAVLDGQDMTQLVLQPACSLGLLHSSWPVLQIWQANQENASDEIIALVPGHHDYTIWRHGQDLHIEPLQAVQSRFLSMLRDETSLLAIFENLWQEESRPEDRELAGTDPASWLVLRLADGKHAAAAIVMPHRFRTSRYFNQCVI